MDNQIFQVPATISKIETMMHGLKLRIDTQENISPEAMKRLFELRDKLGWFTFNVHQIDPEDIIDLPPLKKIEKNEKTPSERLRAVIYRLWEKDKRGHDSADDHYRFMMEGLINYYKEKLNES